MTHGGKPHCEALSGGGGSSAPEPPFQAARLLERCLTDRGFCAALVQKFATRAAELSVALEQSALRQDQAELARHAHSIKGMAANLSANALQTWAAALERTLRAGKTAQVRPLVARVRAEVQRCIDAVSALLEQLSASD